MVYRNCTMKVDIKQHMLFKKERYYEKKKSIVRFYEIFNVITLMIAWFVYVFYCFAFYFVDLLIIEKIEKNIEKKMVIVKILIVFL